MANNIYCKLNKSLFPYSEDIRRYQHHIVLITIYLDLNKVPKGFKLKFHNKIRYEKYKQILKICSLKLMTCAVVIYKKNLLDSKINFHQKVISTLGETFHDKFGSPVRVIKERAKAFANILSNRQKRRFQRDKIDVVKALNSCNKILQHFMNNKTLVLDEKQPREKLLGGQETAYFKSLNLHKKVLNCVLIFIYIHVYMYIYIIYICNI